MKNSTKFLRNSKGFTLTEVLVGLAFLSIVGFVFIGGIENLRKITAKTENQTDLYRQINDILENIRTNVKMYQLAYDSNTAAGGVLEPGTLPMAWGMGTAKDAKDCVSCPGRYGFLIQSYPGVAGLYLVTVRFSHKAWSVENTPEPAQYGFIDYEFVVNAQ